jgi:hypothetical protein
MIVHFIWVGDQKIPESFLSNLEDFKSLNPSDEILEWDDAHLKPLMKSYGREDLYRSSNIFHKLQLARYTVLDHYGGLYTDYDVRWKVPIVDSLGERIHKDLVFIKRKSLYFYKKPESVIKIDLLDDYVIFAKPGITNGFLDYSLSRLEDRSRLKECQTEPFSVYSLTEWAFDLEKFEFFESFGFFDHTEIYNSEECKLAFHDNKKTWEKQTL